MFPSLSGMVSGYSSCLSGRDEATIQDLSQYFAYK